MCLSIFGRLGIDMNLIPFFSIKENSFDSGLFLKVLLKAFIFSSLIALVLYGLKNLICVHLFSKPQLLPYIFWVCLTIPFWSVVLICAGFFRSIKKNNLFAFFNNPGRFLFSLGIFIVLLTYSKDSLNAIKAHFFGVFILALYSFYLALKEFDKIRFKPVFNSWVFIKDAIPMMFSGAIIVFLGWSDTLVLGIYETDETIGVYNVALKIAMITSFSLQAINSILAPKIATYFKLNQKDKFESLIRFSTKLNFIITTVIVVLILIFHRFILATFGEAFLSGSIILIILCVGQLINSFSGSVGIILQMTGHQKKYQNIVFVALIINLALNFLLTPLYGAFGAAVSTVIGIAYWNFSGAFYLKRKLNITSYFSIH